MELKELVFRDGDVIIVPNDMYVDLICNRITFNKRKPFKHGNIITGIKVDENFYFVGIVDENLNNNFFEYRMKAGITIKEVRNPTLLREVKFTGLNFEVCNDCYMRLSNVTETDTLFNCLKQNGYYYDTKTNTLIKLTERVNVGEIYYYITSEMKITHVKDNRTAINENHLRTCNYFKTQEDANLKLEEIQKVLFR